ncbi:MAG: NAD(P)H-dependent glycerol-3-phosphate dehydrogenase [Tissierellia bacterium]|jgi:glycerol-3-phosphate dehydrogenase (NAD(P)+)|nr:NAD(P)H-dependent glycerol-3-phosphate dehydrogenase [Tissierellia bacterium]
MTKTAVLGGGSWGTALARELALKNIDTVLYIRNEEQKCKLAKTQINSRYLPGITLPENLSYSSDLDDSIDGANFIVLAVPTNSVREMLSSLKGKIDEDVILINVAKGIEMDTLMRVSEISNELLPNNSFVALSGPTHAEEVALDYPSTIVAASKDLDAALKVQNLFMSDTFRVYTNDDLLGVELAGALKNVIALANGILVGLGYGDNTMAALMTRGVAEITRLGTTMGALPSTFLGLAGVGDLIVTCTSPHSRNRKCGQLIGEGKSVEEAIEEVGMVVEGIKTTSAAKKLSERYDVDMPITNALYEVLYEGADVKDSAYSLMVRSKKHEMERSLRG